jgi:hypothetical protein
VLLLLLLLLVVLLLVVLVLVLLLVLVLVLVLLLHHSIGRHQRLVCLDNIIGIDILRLRLRVSHAQAEPLATTARSASMRGCSAWIAKRSARNNRRHRAARQRGRHGFLELGVDDPYLRDSRSGPGRVAGGGFLLAVGSFFACVAIGTIGRIVKQVVVPRAQQ